MGCVHGGPAGLQKVSSLRERMMMVFVPELIDRTIIIGDEQAKKIETPNLC
jgi:hypothetical protein